MKRYEIRPQPVLRPLESAEVNRDVAVAELLVAGPTDGRLTVFEPQMVEPLRKVFEGARYNEEFLANELAYNLNQFGLRLVLAQAL
jgi:hypothetical protein